VGQTGAPRYDAVHTRAIALVGGERWEVHDRLRADDRHDYAVRWHLAPVTMGTVEVRTTSDDHVVHATGGRLRVPRRCGELTIEDGWISPAYGVKHPAPVVVVHTRARDADIVTRIEAAP